MKRLTLAPFALAVSLAATVPGAGLMDNYGTDHIDYPINVNQHLGFFLPGEQFYDGFEGDELSGLWTAIEGTDSSTAAQAWSAQIGGVLRLTTGDHASADVAANGSGVTRGLAWNAAMAGSPGDGQDLVFATRLRFNSAVTTRYLYAGWTDIATFEQPFSISATTVASQASDAVGFLYDTRATTDVFHCLGVADDDGAQSEADSTLSATSFAPTAAQWIELVVVLQDTGAATANAIFYINGNMVMEFDAAISDAIAITPVIIAATLTNASGTVDVDKVYVGANSVE